MIDAHDDGMIDLSALAASPSRAAAPAAVFHSEPPPAAFARDAGSSAPGMGAAGPSPYRPYSSQGKTIGMIAGAVAVLLLAGTGIAFAFRGEKPVAIAAPAPPAPPPKVAAAPPPPPAVDPPGAPTTSTPTDDETDAAAAKKAKGKARGAGARAASGGRSFSPSAAAAPKPPIVKAADPCHCHGDFQCNIRCSAGK